MVYAFAVPVLAGKSEAMRSFVAEILGPRKAEYDEMQRRCQVTGETYWLQSDPGHGDTAVVVTEGVDDDLAFQSIMVDPRTEFERWYRDKMAEIFAMPGGSPNQVVGRWAP